MENHHATVEKIAVQVRNYYNRGEPFRIHHGSTNSTRPLPHRSRNTVDISSLSRVLRIDTDANTAWVEPNVPMDRLVESTLAHGLIPPVVTEFPGITAGGAFAGTAGESSSFKHGYFNDTVNTVEMVLGNGDIVVASDREHSDLFQGASGALGSLGITTLLEIRLVRATRYVKATYHHTRSISESIDKIRAEMQNSELDFIDGILFSREHGVVITGGLTDDIPHPSPIQRFSNAHDPWFYLHVKEKTAGNVESVVEYIPLSDYLFRYDRGGFWVGASTFDYFKCPFNRFTRWFLDDFLHTRMLYRALHASEHSRSFIVQDLAIPFATVERFIDYTINSFGIWPLWLCPLRQTHLPTLHPHFSEPEADGQTLQPMLNVGLWGYGPAAYDQFLILNRDLERRLHDHNGMKWLYAHTYYDETKFWELFNRHWYDGLRRKYHAETLPSLWHKVRVDVDAQQQAAKTSWRSRALQFWPVGGLWGILKAIESGDYLIARKSSWKTIAGPDKDR